MNPWLDAAPVGLGDHIVVERSGRLTVRGLGSCVAVVLYDPVLAIGGVAHVVLPSHTLGRDRSRLGKFGDTAVPRLLDDMLRSGARRDRIGARLVGGASMFAALTPSGSMHLGERNVAACRDALRTAGVPVVGEDVGGERGRSLLFHASDGSLTVRSIGAEEIRV